MKPGRSQDCQWIGRGVGVQGRALFFGTSSRRDLPREAVDTGYIGVHPLHFYAALITAERCKMGPFSLRPGGSSLVCAGAQTR